MRTFNLVDLHRSAGFNPLEYLDDDFPEVGIAELVDAIVSNTNGGQSQDRDQFWEKAERALLTALVAFVVAIEDEPTLVDVLNLHKRMESGEGSSANHRSEIDVEMEVAR